MKSRFHHPTVSLLITGVLGLALLGGCSSDTDDKAELLESSSQQTPDGGTPATPATEGTQAPTGEPPAEMKPTEPQPPAVEKPAPPPTETELPPAETTPAETTPAEEESTEDKPAEQTTEKPAPEATKPAEATEPAKPAPPENEHVVLVTNAGVLAFDLFESVAPEHVENFKKLAREGFYDDLTFHRVIEGFIAQAGDPAGSGKQPLDYTIPAEIKQTHVKGAVAMARRSGDTESKDSDPSQFYICYEARPDLDEWGATVFGRVIYGLEKLDRFEKYSANFVENNGFLPADRRTRILKAEAVPARGLGAAIGRANLYLRDHQASTAAAPTATPTTPPQPITSEGPTMATDTEDVRVVLKTDLGDVVIDLFESDAPKHVGNFKKLIQEGFYNGLTFHRVIEGFMAQGGDPKGDGTGGPNYTIPAEIKRPHVRGALAAARKGDAVNPRRESSGSQFYICFGAASHLDGAYSVFGQVVKGMDLVDKFTRGTGPGGLVLPVESRTKILEAQVVPASEVK